MNESDMLDVRGLPIRAQKKLYDLDRALVDTNEYMGVCYFWHRDYCQTLRAVTPKIRRLVHAKLREANLVPRGKSDRHAEIIAKYTAEQMTLPTKQELEAHSIKQDLYDGILREADIAKKYGVPEPMVSKILTGHEWYVVEWPDRSIGPIEEGRHREILSSRHRAEEYNSSKPVPTLSKQAAKAAKEVEKILRKNRRDGPLFTPPRAKDVTDHFHWMDIRAKDPAHPLVEAQEGADLRDDDHFLIDTDPDPHMKKAMVIVLKNIPVEEWQHPASLELIHKTHKQIKESAYNKIV